MDYKVDDLDRRIISCLQQNGRQSNTRIAARLGVTESTIRKRITRLLNEEIIRITTASNPFKLGQPIVAIICISASPPRISDVARSLNSLPEFRFIGLTTGEYDFVAEAWFHELDELRVFLIERLMSIEGITRVVTVHVIQMIRYTYDWGRDS